MLRQTLVWPWLDCTSLLHVRVVARLLLGVLGHLLVHNWRVAVMLLVVAAWRGIHVLRGRGRRECGVQARITLLSSFNPVVVWQHWQAMVARWAWIDAHAVGGGHRSCWLRPLVVSGRIWPWRLWHRLWLVVCDIG